MSKFEFYSVLIMLLVMQIGYQIVLFAYNHDLYMHLATFMIAVVALIISFPVCYGFKKIMHFEVK